MSAHYSTREASGCVGCLAAIAILGGAVAAAANAIRKLAQGWQV